MFHRAKTLIAAACLLAAAVSARAAAPTPAITATSTGSVNVSWTGGATPFIAALSTTSSFALLTATGSVTASATGYPALNPDTTYYFKVKSSADADSLYSAVYSTATRAAAPSGVYSQPPYFTADSSYTAVASLGWNTGGNPEWTSYDIAYNDGVNPDAVARTNNPEGAPLNVGGLNANTTYYFRVRARGVSGVLTAYTAPVSTSTLAMRLAGVSHSVHETTAAVSWTALNHATIQALRSQGYKLLYSVNASMSVPASWTTDNAALSSRDLSGLSRNTTYYYQIGALNHPGTPNLLETRTFTTLGARPQNLARIAVADGSASLGWTALAAADALGFRLEASTSNFAGGAVESSTSYRADLSTLTINTLYPNTTYYFRTASLNTAYAPNYSSTVSSITLALPVSQNLAYINADAQAVTVSFIPLPEAPQAFACEGYRLEGSSLPFGGASATIVSSVSYSYQEDLRALTLSGLAPNTTYHLRLGTLNWERTPNYTVLASTKTGFPAPMAGVTLNQIWSSSAAVNYTPNAAADGHVVEASVYRFFTGLIFSSATRSATLTSLTVGGLSSNTTYYFRAGALYNGTTIYSNTVPEFRQTLAAPLAGLGFPGVFQSSATLSWTPFTGSAKGFLLEASALPSFSPVLSSSGTESTGVSSLTVSGLAPNTSYYFRIATVNDEDYTNYSYAPSTATLANPPIEQAFNLMPNSMTLNWLANSNPPDTRYLVEMDDNSNFGSPLTSSTTVISSATFSGLSPNTIYYSRVTAINRRNRPIPAVNFSVMATDAFDPGVLAPGGITAYSLNSNWTSGGNNPGTWYLASASSSTDFSGTVLTSTTKNFSASFSGLVSNASYYLRVSAINLSDVATDPPTDLGTALTLPTTAYILPQAETFSNMMIDGFTANWASNGNSSHTWYYVQASTRSDFGVVNSSRLVQALTCNFSDLMIDATYWIRVQARGQTGAQAAWPAGADVERSTHTLLYSLYNALALQANEITLNTSYGVISVLLPKGSIGSSTRLRLEPVSVFAPPNSAVSELIPTGIGISLTHFPPTLVLNAITLTVPYRVSDLPLGTDRSRLILALYDEAHAVWIPLPSVSDTGNNRVIAQTWHLSTFQIMQSQPGAGLGAVKIYPNPYRPNSVSDVMHFTNLPAYAKVRIYTFLGELVRTLRADVNGMAHWDGLNGSGRKAASGVYIAFIQTSDKNSSKSFKIALER
ncbi:MAG TPA: hypothetical protein DEQ38_06775 [Elusimicrobia bacterium]|nr:MAG: hypothetical protein A2089_02870 [Elusimicrobia bacterium GWD2_63_28]HCC47806.1 hypothetical protein [Elusimicrobiota bacterium]